MTNKKSNCCGAEVKNTIEEIMKQLRDRGKFQTVEEVEEFFEKSLWEVAEKCIDVISEDEKWEQIAVFYKNRRVAKSTHYKNKLLKHD